MLLLKLVLCRVAAMKISSCIIHSADYNFLFVLEVSEGILRNQKLVTVLDLFSKQILNVCPQFGFISCSVKFYTNTVCFLRL